jgi:hypothetical protein
MIAAAFVIFASLALLVYWLRYISLMIVQTRNSAERSQAMATRIRLNYSEVREVLEEAPHVRYRQLERMLDEDYRLLTALLSAGGPHAVEQRLLRLNYFLTRIMFRACRFGCLNCARNCLRDMADMLDFFAGCAAQESV